MSTRSGKRPYNVKTLFNGTGLMMLGALLALCSYLMVGFDPETALRVLYVIIPVCAILYLVYSVYPREFFSLAAAMTLVALMLWLIAKSTGSNTMSGATVWFLAFGLLICVGLEGLFLLARKKPGKLKVGPVDLSMFSPQYPARTGGHCGRLLCGAAVGRLLPGGQHWLLRHVCRGGRAVCHGGLLYGKNDVIIAPCRVLCRQGVCQKVGVRTWQKAA